MDAAQWPQEIGAEISRISERKLPRPQKEQALNCPRCKSTNTKFCYYNNYSLTQPRYFCKGCRRYWTEGGTLRNVPVGGGSRKNKRSYSSSSSSSSLISAEKTIPDFDPPKFSTRNPSFHDGGGLNLSFGGMSELVALPFMHNLNPQNPNSGLSPLPVPDSGSVFSTGFPGFSLGNRFWEQRTMPVQDGSTGPRFEEPRAVANYERDVTGFWSGMLSGGSW